MDVQWTASAGKHGVAREDVIHAIVRYTYYVPGFDDSRIPGGLRPHLWIGPGRDGESVEVMAERTGRSLVIFHAMKPARSKITEIGRTKGRTRDDD